LRIDESDKWKMEKEEIIYRVLEHDEIRRLKEIDRYEMDMLL